MRLLLRQRGPLALLLVVLAACIAGPVGAGSLLPDIPRGKGDKCVEPTDDMRKNHMNYILHQRDETMHRGIRTEKHSLAECINCHVPKAADPQQQVHYDDPKHFCQTCHTFAAVTIDCFQCHTDIPSDENNRSASTETTDIPIAVTNVDVSPQALELTSGREEKQ